MNAPSHDEIIQQALAQAEAWQDRANALLTHEEKVIQRQMKRLLTHPMDKVVMAKMIDQSFRSREDKRVADQINFIFKEHGAPEFFTAADKILMRLFLGVGRHFPHVSVPRVVDRMRDDSSRSIIPGEQDILHAHLKERKAHGVRMNINHLGEAVLGEEEAAHRLETYLKDLASPHVEYVSVKISTIYSQISSLAFDHTVEILKERLARLFRAAVQNRFTRPDGSAIAKFVNLDMEEYRDMEITLGAFMETLDQEEFKNHSAGIVLQAYIPDSFPAQKELTQWAVRRLAQGGAPIKLRIVKGANMEMEQVESSLNNWPLAPFGNKLEVDANFKRMVRFGMHPERIQAVHLGIGSHNLFEQAYAYILAKSNNVSQFLSFEMLEGMADHVRRALQETGEEMVLYAPVATREEFISAIAYLIRRLDENTAPENFLRYSPDLKPGSEEWEFLQDQFVHSCQLLGQEDPKPHRRQDRNAEKPAPGKGPFFEREFRNEPDTDWSMPANRQWAEGIRDKWKKAPGGAPIPIPLVIAGEEVLDSGRREIHCMDPSQANQPVCAAVCAMATARDISRAVAAAREDLDGWRAKSHEERHRILAKAAVELRRSRGDLIGAAAAGTGKVFTESDPEVSEAIDFVEYYPHSVRDLFALPNLTCRGKGVSLVISPWNFPIAIPCGGIAASLAAGNTVLFKPASAAVLPAWELCQCFWRAGVSKNTLQFLPCAGSSTGKLLTGHPDVDCIILTGGTDTGMAILQDRPGVLLAAETGGKNAAIITAMSDRDQAVKNIIHSAFSNGGQKCSATSLAILEKEVYEDPHFKKQLVDAARSVNTGSAWHFHNKMGPLIQPPGKDLERALTLLEPGESWALQPENINGNPRMWTPGIKWGVQPGSYTHMTEFFGPVLAVMCADNLDHAVEMANQTGYGLTSGLESLDKREQEEWKGKIRAGNLYINRGTTGAIVLRQPFGGMGKSALGAGIKAGGPGYAAQFMDFQETGYPVHGPLKKECPLLRLAQEWQVKADWGGFDEFAQDLRQTARAVKSYLHHYEQTFSREQDFFHLRGQDNILRYLPVGQVAVRVHEDDSLFDVLGRLAAARISGCQPLLSLPPGLETPPMAFLSSQEGKYFLGDIPVVHQADRDLVDMIPEIQRIRYAAPERVPEAVFQAAAVTGFYIARARVLMEGRLELLHYFRQQAVCHNYHRYGNLGERGMSV